MEKTNVAHLNKNALKELVKKYPHKDIDLRKSNEQEMKDWLIKNYPNNYHLVDVHVNVTEKKDKSGKIHKEILKTILIEENSEENSDKGDIDGEFYRSSEDSDYFPDEENTDEYSEEYLDDDDDEYEDDEYEDDN